MAYNFHISYLSDFESDSVAKYFSQWSDDYGVVKHPATTGYFANEEITYDGKLITFTADQYIITSNETHYGFYALSNTSASMFYTFDYLKPQDATSPYHTFYGKLNSLVFGSGQAGSSSRYALSNTEISITGIDFSTTYEEGHDGIIYQTVYSLMGGDTAVLLGLLDEWLMSVKAGLSVNSTFAALKSAGLATPVTSAKLAMYRSLLEGSKRRVA